MISPSTFSFIANLDRTATTDESTPPLRPTAIPDAPFSIKDGSFPGRGAEPNERTLMDLSQEVRINNACLGIAFDGDADRVVFVDENGVVRSAEESGSLIISELLKNKKGNICINVDCSSMVEDVIRENGGTPVRIRVGDAFLADAIQLNDGIFAMESSDHFLIPEVLPSDDGIMVGLYVANIIAGSGKSFSSMLKHLKICPSEKINFKCEDKKKFGVIEKLRKDLEGKYPINTIDGLRLELAGGWALIRASNTTPTLRLTIEAKTLEQLEKIKQEFIPVIEKEIGENNG
jgi:phosphomannomutase